MLGMIIFSFNNLIESIKIISPLLMPLLNSSLIASMVNGLKTGNLTVYSLKYGLILPVIGRVLEKKGEPIVLKLRSKVKKGEGVSGQGRNSHFGATRPTNVPSGQVLTSVVQTIGSLPAEGEAACSGRDKIWISSLVRGSTGIGVG